MNVLTVATSGVITGGAVSKGNCAVSEKIPGRVGSGWAGEGVGGNTDYSEVGVLVTGEHRSKELLDVVHCIVRVAPGVHYNSMEAGELSLVTPHL